MAFFSAGGKIQGVNAALNTVSGIQKRDSGREEGREDTSIQGCQSRNEVFQRKEGRKNRRKDIWKYRCKQRRLETTEDKKEDTVRGDRIQTQKEQRKEGHNSRSWTLQRKEIQKKRKYRDDQSRMDTTE